MRKELPVLLHHSPLRGSTYQPTPFSLGKGYALSAAYSCRPYRRAELTVCFYFLFSLSLSTHPPVGGWPPHSAKCLDPSHIEKKKKTNNKDRLYAWTAQKGEIAKKVTGFSVEWQMAPTDSGFMQYSRHCSRSPLVALIKQANCIVSRGSQHLRPR